MFTIDASVWVNAHSPAEPGQPESRALLDALLAGGSAIVVPTLSTVASPLDGDFASYHARWRGGVSIGGAENAAGIPAISVPNGFGERGLPTGLKFVGRAFEENKLLAIAVKYQDLTDWHQRRPKGCE